MAANSKSSPADGPHGAAQLPSVVVTSYNLEARDEDGFVGDRATDFTAKIFVGPMIDALVHLSMKLTPSGGLGSSTMTSKTSRSRRQTERLPGTPVHPPHRHGGIQSRIQGAASSGVPKISKERVPRNRVSGFGGSQGPKR
jgi:hypothetical protein